MSKKAGGPALADELWQHFEDLRSRGDVADWIAALAKTPAGVWPAIGDRLAEAGAGDWLIALVETGDPAALTVAVEGLAGVPTEAAAAKLAAIGEAVGMNKEIRHLARRSLHRLRSRGVAAAAPAPVRPAEPPRTSSAYRAVEGRASVPDQAGDQALLALVDRPPNLILITAVISQELTPVLFRVEEESRRRVREQYTAVGQQSPDRWIPVPGDYVIHRLREAATAARAAGHPLPSTYVIWEAELDRIPVEHTRPLIYDRLDPADQVARIPNRDELATLLTTLPIADWVIGGSSLQDQAAEIAGLQQSRIVLSPTVQRDRIDQIRRRAWDLVLTDPVVAGLKRSLEELALYRLVKGDRPAALTIARAALALDPASGIPVRRHPIVTTLIDRALGLQDADLPPPDVDPTTGYRRMGGAVILG